MDERRVIILFVEVVRLFNFRREFYKVFIMEGICKISF